MIGQAFQSLLDLYRNRAIEPHVDRVFDFDHAADAHAYIEAGKNVGKVLLKP